MTAPANSDPAPSILRQLLDALADGVQRVGEIQILADADGGFVLCHHEDAERAAAEGFGGLERHSDAGAARAIATYAEDGSYRFLKSRRDLRRGWVMPLQNAADLRLALDFFYPAAVGLWLAWRAGRLETERLREKLLRQTGMYRSAKEISDDQARELAATICADPNCARQALWRLDNAEAPPFPQVEPDVIPLLCHAPCEHFISECADAVKRARSSTPPSPEST